MAIVSADAVASGRSPMKRLGMIALAATALAVASAGDVEQARAEPAAEQRADVDAMADATTPPSAVSPVSAAASPPKPSSIVSSGAKSLAVVPERIGGYRDLIAKEAGRQGLAPEIAEAVMAVESGYNPDAVGGSGEIGLMQIMPSTARMLGFNGSTAELAVPETNIHYGVRYLAQAWRLAGGDLCTATMKYRAGHGETRFSHLSVNYCIAVRGKLTARGFAVTGDVPTPTFGAPGPAFGVAARFGGPCGRKCTVTGGHGSARRSCISQRAAEHARYPGTGRKVSHGLAFQAPTLILGDGGRGRGAVDSDDESGPGSRAGLAAARDGGCAGSSAGQPIAAGTR
ncbi:lytic transglycosylase domain-containing protein [Bradyrhizobium sp. USDA 4353]